MSNNNAYVSTGKPKIGGAVFRAPLGTTLPTTADETLDAAFVNQGYCSEDGLTNNNNKETESIKAWGGDTVLVVGTEHKDEFGVTLIEVTNPDVLKTVHGDDKILVTDSPYYDSIFYPCGRYLYIWTQIYVKNLGTDVGTVGHFYNIMEWIRDEEADRLKNEAGM